MIPRAAYVAVLPGVLSLLLLAAPAANAQRVAISDPAGDAVTGGLDITSATVMNRDRRVVAEVTTAELASGAVIVSADRRDGTGVRLVSSRRSDGTVNGRVYAGAFTDTDVENTVVKCPRFRVAWDDGSDTVTLSMPSRCLDGGDYAALRFAVLTERAGADVDAAPTAEDGDIASTAWVARG